MTTQNTDLIRTDLTPLIATQLEANISDLISGKFSNEIGELLEQRGVVAFRELNLTDEQQLAFTQTLNTTDIQDYKVTKITMDPLENPNADYIKGAFYWHIDGTMLDIPVFASVMSSRRLSETGGRTEFSNTYAAYDALPEDEKAALEGLQVVHMFETSQLYVNPEPSIETLKMWQSFQPNVLPLVWTHRSGRKSLVLGSTASHIEGMSLREGRALLTKLRDWATQPEFVYSHEWKLGDLVIWDNTGTMHRATPYPLDSGRLMYRTQIAGDEPFM
ncbi:TauD/TfdA family dioxygenase [Pseudomaricurvus sp. HS19]|uniref:TauD/TfdA dioxygenase family protein n=1 Tax=Pseudomaricurvus sp. HS19 TaxID=2692626 RepID=UPI00136C7947|nr:TauD/TfdA family dioxygenase [Pseudomaricurvus sp. HS19]MYM62822.1 TauD/TfdA family dioxygenase [Pseudomaricurvus sp. HS19]